MVQKVFRRGKEYSVTPAGGVSGIIISILGETVFRVTDENGEFTDYDFLHGALSVTIAQGELASFYKDEKGDDHLLDDRPEDLGIE